MGGSSLPCRGQEAPLSALRKELRKTAWVVNRPLEHDPLST